MFLRVECHRKRGKAQDLYVNNVARALEKVDAHVKAHDMEKQAIARHVSNDIKINTATVVLRTQGTGMSRDDVHSQVDSYLDKQATSWRPSLKDARTIMDYASAALPLVGGVVRCAPTFGGFLPVHTPDEVIDLVTGAAKHVSDGYSGDEEIASQAPWRAAESGGGYTRFWSGASGRSVRAAQAEAAMESFLPGSSDLLPSLAKSAAEKARCFNMKPKTKHMK